MSRTKIWPSPKLVVIGGGTGTSTILYGLKEYTDDITAIITVMDNGGSTGRLREDLDIIAMGDIRSCLVALSDQRELLGKLLMYRFGEGELKGHNFGNLFLAAMNEILGDFGKSIKETGKILNISGKVLPVTLEKANLIAELENGEVVVGESEIPEASHNKHSRIKKISSSPHNFTMLDEAKEAIKKADIIILGPGSLYTSIIPNLLANDMVELLDKSKAKLVYVANIMDQIGESESYTISDHYKAIIDHSKEGIIDYVIANNGEIPDWLIDKYKKESADKIEVSKTDEEFFKKKNVKLIKTDLVKITDDFVRHDADKLAEVIIEQVLNK